MSNAISRLELRSFTQFSELDIDFAPKINIIVGENGTGKTHLLKAAYALCCSGSFYESNPETGNENLTEAMTQKLLRLFMPIGNKLANVRRRGASGEASAIVKFALDARLEATFSSSSKSLSIDSSTLGKYLAKPIFIPTKEALSLVRGMMHPDHDQNTVEMIFDDTYVDLAKHLMRSGHGDAEHAIDLDPRFGSIIPELTDLIGGRYSWQDGDFCFQHGRYEERANPKNSRSAHAQAYQDSVQTSFVASKEPLFSSSMTAEGFKKIGMLHRLLSKGTLASDTSGPLFWDEPESNLNPKLMKLLVQTLLELSRNGQQIILATHDYVLLKWFDLLTEKGKEDHVRFHALYRDVQESGRIKLESTDDYRAISPNAIADTFNDLTKEQVRQKMGSLGK